MTEWEASTGSGQALNGTPGSSRKTELDTYLRTGFVPDEKLPEYKGPEGIERWYRDSAMNARVWWSQDKDEYATESTKVNGRSDWIKSIIWTGGPVFPSQT